MNKFLLVLEMLLIVNIGKKSSFVFFTLQAKQDQIFNKSQTPGSLKASIIWPSASNCQCPVGLTDA